MNASTITTRVADLIRNPNSAMPSEWERSIKNKQAESKTAETTVKQEQVASPSASKKNTDVTINSEGDTLSLSPLAAKILEESDSRGPSEWEKARSDRVQRVQQLVHDGKYTISPEMADDIAQKIVSMLMPSSD